MSAIELTRDVCVDLLKRYIDAGYKNCGLTIKEAATIHRYFRILKNQEKQEEGKELNERDIFSTLFRILDVFSGKGAFTLDDSAVIDKVISFINQPVETSQPESQQSSIKEI